MARIHIEKLILDYCPRCAKTYIKIQPMASADSTDKFSQWGPTTVQIRSQPIVAANIDKLIYLQTYFEVSQIPSI